VNDFIILKYNHFESSYKSLQDHKYKLISINILIHIIEYLSLLFYQLNLSSNFHIHDIISVIYLWKFNNIDDDINSFLIIMNDAEEWKIEKIEDKRMSQKTVEYLIKWKDYNVKVRTWKPITNLRNI